MTLPSYAVDFRGLPACPCQAKWIPELEARLRHLGIIQGNLAIAQMIGLYEASAKTHGDPAGPGLRKGGGVTDFWLTGHLADKAVRVMRDMGADPTWHRLPNWDGKGGSEHVHSGMRGCPHRTLGAVAQEWAVDHDGDGLVGNTPDPGPRPLSGRTWQQGITWANQQQQKEDDLMAFSDWSDAEKKAFGTFIQEQVQKTLIPDIPDPGGKTKQDQHLGNLLRRIVAKLGA